MRAGILIIVPSLVLLSLGAGAFEGLGPLLVEDPKREAVEDEEPDVIPASTLKRISVK